MIMKSLFSSLWTWEAVLEGEDAGQGLADEPDALVALLVHRVVQVVLGLRRRDCLS